MFVDEVEIKVKAGNGGDGCLAFRREKYVPMGGPYGGNGGRGGDIIFYADEGLSTLIDLRYQKLIKADKGENGLGKNQHGEDAKDVYIKVPVGTIVTDLDTNQVICDLDKHNKEFIVAEGGRGGRGNTAFKTHANPAPNFAENGEEGEEKLLKVELKLLADVGLVGLPSVGKSTIISKVSASRPKIADYPFTTLIPNLGVVRVSSGKSFVLTDLPGLIEGASLGVGLGDRFLKHVERCRIIAHVIDMDSYDRDPYEDYLLINKELKNYNEKLALKPQVIIANKMDLPNAEENLKKFKEKVDLPIFEISAIKNIGLDKVMNYLADTLEILKKEELEQKEETIDHVIYEFKEDDFDKLYVNRVNDTFVVTGKKLEKLFKMTNFNTYEAHKRFMLKLKKMDIDKVLKEAGIKEDDKINIYGMEFTYKD